MVVWEESVGAKLVINYQQLSTIDGGQDRSTIQRSRSCPLGLRINNNYQQLQKDKIGQQLTTIAERQSWSSIINNYQQLMEDKIGQQLSTINQNCKRTRKCQPLSTITNNYFRSFSRDYCDSQCEHCEQPN